MTPGKHRTKGLQRSAPEVGEAAEAAKAHYLATRDEIAAEIAAAGAGKLTLTLTQTLTLTLTLTQTLTLTLTQTLTLTLTLP